MKIKEYLDKDDVYQIVSEVKFRKDHYEGYVDSKNNPYSDLLYNLNLIKEDESLWHYSVESLLTKSQYYQLIEILTSNIWFRYSGEKWVNINAQKKLKILLSKLKSNVDYTEPKPNITIYINSILAPNITDYFIFTEDGVEKILFGNSNHKAFVKELVSVKYTYTFNKSIVYFEVK